MNRPVCAVYDPISMSLAVLRGTFTRPLFRTCLPKYSVSVSIRNGELRRHESGQHDDGAKRRNHPSHNQSPMSDEDPSESGGFPEVGCDGRARTNGRDLPARITHYIRAGIVKPGASSAPVDAPGAGMGQGSIRDREARHARGYGVPRTIPAGPCRRTPAGGVTRAPAWRPRARPGVRMDQGSVRAREGVHGRDMGRLGICGRGHADGLRAAVSPARRHGVHGRAGCPNGPPPSVRAHEARHARGMAFVGLSGRDGEGAPAGSWTLGKERPVGRRVLGSRM